MGRHYRAWLAIMLAAGLFQGSTAPSAWAAGATPAQIQALYQKYLGREADDSGLKYWTQAAGDNSLSAVEAEIKGSEEAKLYSASQAFVSAPAPVAAAPSADLTAQVQALFQKYLGRAASPEDVLYWAQSANAQSISAVEAAIRSSPEATARSSAASDKALSDQVAGLYDSFLGRKPDSEGLAYWLQIAKTQSLAAVREGLQISAEGAAYATASPDKIPSTIDLLLPEGTKTQFVALRVGASAQFLAAGDDGTITKQGTPLKKSQLFRLERISKTEIALRSASNDQYVQAGSAGANALKTSGGNRGDWETFSVTELGAGQLALKAKANQKFLTFTGNSLGASAAQASDASSFRLQPVIDMKEVMLAFALRHSKEAKKRSDLGNTGAQMTNDQIVFDREGGIDGEVVYGKQLDPDNPEKYQWQYDFYQLQEDKVGVSGTSWPCSWPCVASKSAAPIMTIAPLLTYSDRFLTPDMLGTTYPSKVKVATSMNQGIDVFSPPGEGKDFEATNLFNALGMRDLKGSLGNRWVITITTDPNSMPDVTWESFSFDLGPSPYVYDPEYGFVGYDQNNKPTFDANNKQGPSKGDFTIESFGDLIPFAEQENTFFYFDHFDSKTDYRKALAASKEASARISDLYHDKLHRAPDSGGLQYWLKQLEQGSTFDEVAKALQASPEANAP